MDRKTSRICKGYSLEDVLNMDEVGLFFETLPQKGLIEKGKKERGGNKVKSDVLSHCLWLLMVPMFVTLFFYGDPRNLFKKLKIIYRPHGVHYFANAKA